VKVLGRRVEMITNESLFDAGLDTIWVSIDGACLWDQEVLQCP